MILQVAAMMPSDSYRFQIGRSKSTQIVLMMRFGTKEALRVLGLTRSLVSALLLFSGSTSGSSSFSFSSYASSSLSFSSGTGTMPTFQLCQVCSCPEGRLKGFGTDLGGLGLDTVDFLITLFFAFSLGAVLGAAFAFVDDFFRTEPGVAEGFSLSFSDFAGVWATIDSFGIPSAMSAVDHSQYITNSQNKKPQKVVGRLKMALNVLFTRTAHQLMTEVTEEQATRNYTSPKQEHLTSKWHSRPVHRQMRIFTTRTAHK